LARIAVSPANAAERTARKTSSRVTQFRSGLEKKKDARDLPICNR
jgi:hypothetical protein